MEGQHIYEGTVAVDKSLQVYLVDKKSNTVVDINTELARFTGEKVKVVVAKAEDI